MHLDHVQASNGQVPVARGLGFPLTSQSPRSVPFRCVVVPWDFKVKLGFFSLLGLTLRGAQ